MYDVIGDIHGHADALRRLLIKLDYVECNGAFCHPHRSVVFLGDFIDRGPDIPGVLQIVRSMVERGSAQAVMGNHEFNAISFHTSHPTVRGGWVRPRSVRNIRQYVETLRQVPGPDALEDHIAWFARLPLSLELGGLRIVHACWDPDSLDVIAQATNGAEGLDENFFRRAGDPQDPLFEAVERVLKGPEAQLPGGAHFEDGDGHARRRVRTRWYLPEAEQVPWAEAVFASSKRVLQTLPQGPMGAPAHSSTVPYPASAPPVLFGHYWMPGDRTPGPLAPNVACLDSSVAARGRLCAYRWDGEAQLKPEHFESVPA